jgi:phosphatidylglycerol:prolipoprotein diacylglycerol transferase
MHPVICKIGPFTVYSYGLMLVVAFLVASELSRQEAKRQLVDPDPISNLGFIAFISGIIGARLFFVIRNIDYYIQSPGQIIMLQYGGLSWFGGLLLAIISVTIYLKKKRLPIYKILDLVVPFVALAQAIGRVGCLLNGCCLGKVSKFGLYFSLRQAVLVPTQLYSSLILIFIFIILRILQQRPHREGQIFFAYLLLYSLKRFFIEFWRENELIFWGLSLFQIISIAIFFFALIKIIAIHRNKV